MKSNIKSSITLPAGELKRVLRLRSKLRAKSNVEVVRRGLLLLEQSVDRDELRAAFAKAAAQVRATTTAELAELDQLSSEGLIDR